LENNEGVYISGVQGDVIGGKVSGTGNIVGKDITLSGTINISNSRLEKIPSEYAKALKDFSENVNRRFIANHIPPQEVEPIEKEINDLAKDVEEIKNVEAVSPVQKRILNGKFAGIMEKVIKVLPKAAEVAATFTPLAPFSKLIGESVEKIVAEIQKSV
jgi:hypothetical protein